MAETANTAIIASKVMNDIFRAFHWHVRPQEDANFCCVLDHHLTPSGKKKLSHPCDSIFYYLDPYLNKIIYLHTDLKSYSKTTLQIGKIRDALNSLAMTIECAHLSQEWRSKFPTSDPEPYEIRGLLFVLNHDNQAPISFNQQLSKIDKKNLNIARSQLIHVLGPKEINALYSVAIDIRLSIQSSDISPYYRFVYPDQTLWKRQTTDDFRTAATIETLLSPFFILRHDALKDDKDQSVISGSGSLVYYSREGDTIEEFMYLLDSLLRYQLVNAKDRVRIRVFNQNRSVNMKNNFEKAKERYCQNWGFHGDREMEIKSITIDAIAQMASNYSPDEIGWRVEK